MSETRNWYYWERRGWSWATGWTPTRGGYYASAWRDRPQPVRISGLLSLREVFVEGGRTIEEAEVKLWERLEALQ